MIEEVNEKYDNFEERKNRLRFYENNGFHRFGYLHHEYRVDYEMLGMGEYVSREEYIELMYSVFPKERYDYAMNLYWLVGGASWGSSFFLFLIFSIIINTTSVNKTMRMELTTDKTTTGTKYHDGISS